MDSLSNPSEPPDIRRWFSSYVYESPELSPDFKGYSSGGSGCVEQGFDGEEKTKGKEENHGQFQKIREADGLVKGEKAASIGFVKSNITAEDHDHEIKNASQDMGSSDSLTLSSEPPEIMGWFSSYVYESPTVDSSDAFKDSVSTESESEKVACNAENCSKGKGERLSELTGSKKDVLAADKNISSNVLAEFKISDKDNRRFHQYNREDTYGVQGNKMSSVKIEFPVKMISGQERKPRSYDECSTENDEKLSFDGQVPNGNNNRKSPKKWTQRRDSGHIGGSNDKENSGSTFAKNGFVSTRNGIREREYDSCLKRPMEAQSDYIRNGVTDLLSVVRRKPLSETANNNSRHTVYSEITGKWQCPQNRKPNLGPPLKQLRLEQWVHRVLLSIRMAQQAIDVRVKKDMASALASEEGCHEQHSDTKGRLEGLSAFSEK